MKQIAVSEAFQLAAPRRPAVLCIKNSDGSTDMILTQWFTWLNMRNQPMLSYAMERTASIGLQVENGGGLCLAFPDVKDAPVYRAGVRTAANGREKQLPDGVDTVYSDALAMQLPAGCEIVLRCTLSNAYNYPFAKTRIFNCNLEEALVPDTQA